MLPLISTGMIISVTRNALVRTAARYSRTATTNILRMVVLLRVRSGDADEDVVQRWLANLEVPQAAALHQMGQDCLRVRLGGQPQFLIAAKVRYFDDTGKIVQCRRTVQMYAQSITSVGILDRLQCAVENLTALVDHENEIAQLLGHAHIVSRKHDGRTTTA